MRRVEMRESALEVASEHASLVPVQRELLADMLTPVSAYARLCPPGQLGFLLESVEGGERLARYSYIGYRPEPYDVGPGDPLPALARIAEQRAVAGPGLPRFLGGAVGYVGYEAARHFEIGRAHV